MRKKLFVKAVLDGIIQGTILVGFGEFLVSKYAFNFSIQEYIIFVVLGSIMSAVICVISVLKEFNNRNILSFFLIGKSSLIIFLVVMFALKLTLKFSILPLQEANNANGIVIIIVSICFILSSIILRSIFYIILLMRNRNYKT